MKSDENLGAYESPLQVQAIANKLIGNEIAEEQNKRFTDEVVNGSGNDIPEDHANRSLSTPRDVNITPSLQTLSIQNPNRLSENGILQPPLDPPPFDTPNVRKCIKTTVRIQNFDKPQEVLILTSISTSVDSILNSFDPQTDNNVADSFDDSDFSDFSDSQSTSTSSEEGSSSDDTNMMEDETDEEEKKQSSNHGDTTKAAPQCTSNRQTNQGYRMKAYLLRREPLCENSHGVFTTHVYYGRVLHKTDVNWVATDEFVAIKAVSWQCILACRNRLSEDFVKEIAALEYISNWHRNRGKSIMDTHVLTADMVMSNESHLFIVMPYCTGGDLCMRVAEKRRFSEDESRLWFKQILKGLETLQRMKICHKDLSPENMIILNNNALVIDFGMCLKIPYTTTGRHLISPQTPCGKLPHMAPELYRKRAFDGHAVDLWAAGTILLFMLTGKRLRNPPIIDHAFENLHLDGISEIAMDLIRRMLRLHAKDRLSLEEIKKHPFLVQR